MSRFGIVLRRVGIIGTLVCWFSSSVGADPIRSTFRWVQGTVAATVPEGGFGPFSLEDGTDLPGLFNRVLTDELASRFDYPTVASYTVTQRTDVSASGWSGSGTASTFTLESDPALVGTVSADLGMTIEFALAKPMSYLLTGTISGKGARQRFALMDHRDSVGCSRAVVPCRSWQCAVACWLREITASGRPPIQNVRGPADQPLTWRSHWPTLCRNPRLCSSSGRERLLWDGGRGDAGGTIRAEALTHDLLFTNRSARL